MGCSYELGNGINYIFINCRFDWNKVRGLYKQDRILKKFMHDKYLLKLREMHWESFDRYEENTREEGIMLGGKKAFEIAKNLLDKKHYRVCNTPYEEADSIAWVVFCRGSLDRASI